ncbi:hypothetical protein CCAX7_000420 [Capsulimonas corticalis]|uniref:Uncharacterized protein n=1 Tax=Capsulimonas corticalis TaxID=2219043 RepID=A0A402CRJ5_9BACT|nr:hypothetical protein [Capsulimonas corticalis]BDI27991.1 hypothetical protein CCAX7_000420 [Capsulimonas corticalis]
MPLDPIAVRILRASRSRTPTGGKTVNAEADIPGSPFSARVYRVAQVTVNRDEAEPGIATQDQMRRLSILDPAAGVRKNDIALIPSDDDPSVTERAKVLRVRRYSDRVQCDLETGVDG